MTTELETETLGRRVLTAVAELTSESQSGTDPVSAMNLMASLELPGDPESASVFSEAVSKLRQAGLLMSSPSGDLRLTSAGRRWMADASRP